MPEDNSSELKVVDRRRFIQEGNEVRENPDVDRSADTPKPTPPPVEPSPPSSRGPEAGRPQQGAAGKPAEPIQGEGGTDPANQGMGQQSGAETAESRQEAAQRRADQAAAGLPPADFITLLEFLTQQVTLYLGEPDPMGRAIPANLPAAGMFIDLMGVLKDKTAGNLSLEEGQALDQLLYALRLRYVQQRGK